MSKYLANRKFPRLVPQNSIPVAIHDVQHGQAFGLITDISEAGCSFDTGISYAAGSTILLRISFDRDMEPFVTEANVMWSTQQEAGKSSFVHGVKFSRLEEEQLKTLYAILQRPEFRVAFSSSVLGGPERPEGDDSNEKMPLPTNTFPGK